MKSLMKMIDHLEYQLHRWTFSVPQQQAFLEDLKTLIEDGVPANQALSIISQVTQGAQKQLAITIQQRITEGKGISAGMASFFPPHLIAIIQAGEEGGTLIQAFNSAIQSLASRNNVLTSLLNSITYPLVVVVLGLCVSVFIHRTVLQSFTSIKPVHTWPALGQNLVAFAEIVEHWWPLFLALGIVALVGFFKGLETWSGSLRKSLDDIPPFSFYRQLCAARLMVTLGLLLSNGIPLKKGLDILKISANSYVLSHVYRMDFQLSGGKETIAEVLDTGLIAKADILRLRVIAQSRGFEYALIRLGEQARERNERQLKTLGKIIGGLLLVLGTCLAAFMIFGIYGIGSFISH